MNTKEAHLIQEKDYRFLAFTSSTKRESRQFHVLAPVVQTLDSATQRINHYPADKYYGNQLCYPLDRDLSDG